MNWEALGAIAELIAAFGVIATLAYLALQIKQNTRAMRTASFQSATDSLNQANLTAASSQEISEAIEKSMTGGFDELDPVTKRRYFYLVLSILRVFETAYYQKDNGLLEQESWHRYDHSLRNVMLVSEGFIDWWSNQRFGFTKEFSEYVNEAIRDAGLDN